MVTQEAKSMAELMSFVEYSPHFSYGSNNRRNKSIPGKNEDIFKYPALESILPELFMIF